MMPANSTQEPTSAERRSRLKVTDLGLAAIGE
jgi:hypothetical protein